MGNFFKDQYDLYSFIKKGTEKAIEDLSIVSESTGVRIEQEIKDACTSISSYKKFDFAFDEADLLFDILENNIGVIN